MNDAESHNLFWVNMPDFSSSVKDMQVQRGAGTSTNGAGAFYMSLLNTDQKREKEHLAQMLTIARDYARARGFFY